jgi:hypothetical protein
MVTKLKKKLPMGLAIFLAATIAYCMRYPLGPRPTCGALIDSSFQLWMLDNHSNVYPNSNGDGNASIRLIAPYLGRGTNLSDGLERYGYVPGLRDDDPKNLVLMYLKVKTRCTWHGDTTPNIFSPKRWKIDAPGIARTGPDPEGGELVDTPEFKKRMQKTLDFLKENQRPSWQTVVAEQTAFLNSINE